MIDNTNLHGSDWKIKLQNLIAQLELEIAGKNSELEMLKFSFEKLSDGETPELSGEVISMFPEEKKSTREHVVDILKRKGRKMSASDIFKQLELQKVPVKKKSIFTLLSNWADQEKTPIKKVSRGAYKYSEA